jgi:hypothetical protein
LGLSPRTEDIPVGFPELKEKCWGLGGNATGLIAEIRKGLLVGKMDLAAPVSSWDGRTYAIRSGVTATTPWKYYQADDSLAQRLLVGAPTLLASGSYNPKFHTCSFSLPGKNVLATNSCFHYATELQIPCAQAPNCNKLSTLKQI